MLQLILKSLEPPEVPQQQDPDDLPHVHWAMKRFIAWQQQHIDLVQQQTAPRTVSSSSPSKHGTSSSSSSSSRGRGSVSRSSSRGSNWQQQPHGQQQQQQQQVQQQFLQLLGPRLQLLDPEQAALLQQFCSSASSSSSSSSSTEAPGFSSTKLWGLPHGRGGLGLVNEWVSPWSGVLVAVLEAVVSIARAASAPVESWEAASTLLRESYPLLPQSLQVSLMEGCAAAGAAMGSRARQRPGPGPGPQVQLKRVLPGPPCLQPLHLSATDMAPAGSASAPGSKKGEGSSANAGPFIFNPYAAKRKGASAAAAAEAALPEWVAGEEGWVEVLLVNPCATPLKLEQLQLVVQPLPDHQKQQQQQQQVGDKASMGRSSSSSAAGKSKQCSSHDTAEAGGAGSNNGGGSSSSAPAHSSSSSSSSAVCRCRWRLAASLCVCC
ncbi:hypothetical protein COO60DRAFT_151357 [Scenedesmus sp. NREL 46B-D3]|nr:hypothetical protein COO60DRAFT_151357 [Scenedesmus sp. NREL 46B-D3]